MNLTELINGLTEILLPVEVEFGEVEITTIYGAKRFWFKLKGRTYFFDDDVFKWHDGFAGDPELHLSGESAKAHFRLAEWGDEHSYQLPGGHFNPNFTDRNKGPFQRCPYCRVRLKTPQSLYWNRRIEYPCGAVISSDVKPPLHPHTWTVDKICDAAALRRAPKPHPAETRRPGIDVKRGNETYTCVIRTSYLPSGIPLRNEYQLKIDKWESQWCRNVKDAMLDLDYKRAPKDINVDATRCVLDIWESAKRDYPSAKAKQVSKLARLLIDWAYAHDADLGQMEEIKNCILERDREK